MSDSVVVGSGGGDGGELTLTPLNQDTLLAEFVAPVVNATVRVYLLSGEDFVPYFDDLASHWKGWEGAKTWESLEGQLRLECTRDSLGHIFFRVTLRDGLGDANWLAAGTIQIAAGELEQLSKSVRRVFRGRARAV